MVRYTPRTRRVGGLPKGVNLYGPTEAAVGITPKWVDNGQIHNIGAPHFNSQCHVVDPETLQVQPVGVSEKLLAGGIQVARGYLNRPDLTSEKFIHCPWDMDLGRLYRSANLLRWLPCGQLAIHGRMNSQIKLRGFRIKLGEVET